MALNFPNTPANGQAYVDPTGQKWVYETSTNSWTAEGTSGGMVYKGGLDISATAPTGTQAGWVYTVTTGGAADASFTGITGSIAKGTQLVFDGTNWQQQGVSNWTRNGTELTPVNAGDSVFTSGAVKVGGTTAAPNITVNDGSGRLLVGASTSEPVGFAHLLQLEHGSGARGISLIQNTADAFGSHIDFAKSRSTGAGGNTIVQDNDSLGNIIFRAADGSDKASSAAYIACQVDGTPGADDTPGRLVFATTPDGAAAPVERMRIGSNGTAIFTTASHGGVSFSKGGTEPLTSNSEVGFRINTDGIFGYAGAGAPTAQINNDGSATFAGNITAANVTSDIRFKENLAPASSQLDDIKQLSVLLKNWDWNDDAPMNEEIRSQRFLGLVAQEAEKVCPHISYTVPRTKQGKELTPAVFEDRPDPEDEENFISVEVQPATYEELDDSYKALKHDVILMKLLGTVGELIAKNEVLEAKVAALEAK